MASLSAVLNISQTRVYVNDVMAANGPSKRRRVLLEAVAEAEIRVLVNDVREGQGLLDVIETPEVFGALSSSTSAELLEGSIVGEDPAEPCDVREECCLDEDTSSCCECEDAEDEDDDPVYPTDDTLYNQARQSGTPNRPPHLSVHSLCDHDASYSSRPAIDSRCSVLNVFMSLPGEGSIGRARYLHTRGPRMRCPVLTSRTGLPGSRSSSPVAVSSS
eukprot:2793711-Rhodomonas_salina.2